MEICIQIISYLQFRRRSKMTLETTQTPLISFPFGFFHYDASIGKERLKTEILFQVIAT